MDSLFDITPGGELIVQPEVLLIKEFEVLWDRDTSDGKKTAKKEMLFVWAMCNTSDKNVWVDYKDDVERGRIIAGDLFDDVKWKPDINVIKAIEKYKDRTPKSPLDVMLDSVEETIYKLSDYLRSVNFEEVDNQGRLIHNPKGVRDIISSMGKTVADYNELKRQVEIGKVNTDSNIRGGGDIGAFELEESLSDLME